MNASDFLLDILVFLFAAVVVVPVFRRLRSSPVLGFLAAGIVVGPFGLGLIGDDEAIEPLAELGVVFLLFAIGLELSFQRLWVMRRWVFGLGLAQVMVTSLAVGITAAWLGLAPAAALVVGGALALSSTAFVLQLIVERGEQVSRAGRAAFAVLLFQDLAVLPLLAVVPLLGGDAASLGGAIAEAAFKALVALAAIVFLGRFVLQPVYRVVAAVGSPELFVSATLLAVLGTGWLAGLGGLSMAVGAFLAGLMLAETAYRHQVEADIRPFRGLLLGLFFMATGAAIDLGVIADRLDIVAAVLIALVVVKAIVLVGLGRLFALPLAVALHVGLLLAQGGEFAFVVFGVAARTGVLADETTQILIAATALSMVATPFLAQLGSTLVRRLEQPAAGSQDLEAGTADLAGHTVIAGFGRVGQTVAKLLALHGTPYIALDLDHHRVEAARRAGEPAFYGDATRAEVLAAAGAGRARAIVLTLDNTAAADRAVAAIRAHWHEIMLIARAHDRLHAERLRAAGVSATIAEAAEASLQLGGLALTAAGADEESVAASTDALRRDDYAALGPVITGRES